MKIPASVVAVAKNPAVRKAALALVLAVAAALGISFSTGCHSLTPAQQARVDKFECQARAIAPLTLPALDAEKLLVDLYEGKADLGTVIANTGATEAEVKAALAALRACTTAELPEREPPAEYAPSVLHAPPPAYGNKVL